MSQRSTEVESVVESIVEKWSLVIGESGDVSQSFRVTDSGQYRLSVTMTDSEGRTIEGAQVFTVFGDSNDWNDFRFAPLELVPDQNEYQPGDTVKLRINSDMADSAVMLFIKPSGDAVASAPKWVQLQGKSAVVDIPVDVADQPNFYVEAITIRNGWLYSEVREIVVPPEQRLINAKIEVEKSSGGVPASDGGKDAAATFLPGAEVTATVTLTDGDGNPIEGSVVLTVYDRAVEYISGGSNVPEIRTFFWDWRRRYTPRQHYTFSRIGRSYAFDGEATMQPIGVFGDRAFDGFANLFGNRYDVRIPRKRVVAKEEGTDGVVMVGSPATEPMSMMTAHSTDARVSALRMSGGARGEVDDVAMDVMVGMKQSGEGDDSAATVRKNFADTAFWSPNVAQVCCEAPTCATFGKYRATFTMPEDITGWKVRAWAMGTGVRVGEATTEIVTAKDLILRMQAPRFFTQRDEVVLSANVHNYLKSEKNVRVMLALEGKDGAVAEIIETGLLRPASDTRSPRNDGKRNAVQTIVIPARGERRVDWRIKVLQPGTLTVRMTAVADGDSDGVERSFPVQIHGMLKTEAWSGLIPRAKVSWQNQRSETIKITVPSERLAEQTRLEIRYSPTLAGTMLDALPYLLEYPYGCTEQTLNRFLPAVVVRHTLTKLGMNLKELGVRS